MRALAIAALMAASPAFADWVPVKPSTDPDPVVRIEGDTLTYIGGINATGLTKLSEAVRHLPRGQVTKMIVNSGGGDTKPGIFIAECDIDRIRWLRKETDCYGPPMPWNTKPGTLRDWRRSDIYRKNFPNW